MKYKLKTKRALTKRVRVNGSGHLKYRKTNRAHHAPYRTTKQKRHLRKNGILSDSAMKMVKGLINGKQGGKR
ncbi:MAG: 50S ribosomal protein L35 [Mycoplasmataceae bacterium]|jgi:large subunit ribosomal protein L35|nr:50S ribosomal protein L35 [Mycoplasmataceae bacterium]